MIRYPNLPKTILIWIAFFIFILIGLGAYAQNATDDAEVIFHVSWYDVGKAALEGLDGVKSVMNGIRHSKLWFKETNTVVYDPRRISIDEMKSALQNARTYKGILAPEE